MSEAIAAILPFAVGVGLSPIPIIAVILVLFSERAQVNGPLFLAGWFVGLTSLFVGVFLLAATIDLSTDKNAQDGVAWLRLAFGVLLVVLGIRKLCSRPCADTQPAMPPWMARIDQISPPRAARLGLLLSFNPKNLVLGAGAATAVAQLGAVTSATIAATAVFVLVGSAGAIVAVVYSLVGGDAARAQLDTAKSWLTAHSTAMMAVLFLVFGAILVSQGLGLRS